MTLIFRMTKNNRYSLIPLIGVAERFDVDVVILKDFEKIEDIVKDIEKKDEIYVAFSFSSIDYEESEREIEKVKKLGLRIIAGGPHPTAMPHHVLKMGVDYVFRGDGEKNFEDFLRGIRPKDGVFDGLTRRIDLNEYPNMAKKHDLYMPFEITRGCPFRCAYCYTPRIAGEKPRHRRVDRIIEEAKAMLRSGRHVARFISPNAFGYGSTNGITPDEDAIFTLLKSLRDLGFKEIYFGTFPSDVRPESVNRRILRIVRKYCVNESIVIGAQSGSERILKILKRGSTIEIVENAINLINSEGFVAHVDFIFGFPFEEKEDIERTFEFIDRILSKYDVKIHAHTFMPLPGTELFKFGGGKLTPEVRRKLGYLSRIGKLDGYWHKQEQISERLEKLSKYLKSTNI